MGMFLRRGPAPKLGVPLSDITEGTLIKLNELGSPVEFYVSKHDYEPDLNGNGRTLLVRKDCYDIRAFSSDNNAFSGSLMDTWLNNAWIALLDADVRAAIGKTTFYYTPGDGNNTVTTLQRAVFLLSCAELNNTGVHMNREGTALAIASTLWIAYMNGSAANQWTRSPYTYKYNYVWYFNTKGYPDTEYFSRTSGSRPIFTLPSDFIVTDDMLA